MIIIINHRLFQVNLMSDLEKSKAEFAASRVDIDKVI